MTSSFYPMQALRGKWGWLLACGILVTILGFLALSVSVLTTLIATGLLGIFLILGGMGMIIHAFQSRQWRGFGMSFLLGILYVICGFLLFIYPAVGALTLTLLMAAFFLASGFIRCIMAVAHRFEHWGWYFASGLVSLMLGILIWAQWPISALFMIGLFVGIDLLLIGISLVVLAWEAHKLPPQARAT